MLGKIKTFFLCISCIFVLVACGGHTVPFENIKTDIVGQHSLDDVKNAIFAAGKERGWVMHSDRPGVIQGTVHVRNHVANIEVVYSQASYNINYVSSENLTLHSREGVQMISANYMKWVRLLDKGIQVNLAQ